MSDQDVFNETQATTNSGDPAVSSNPFDDKLKTIVNESGQPKYKDVESALDALNYSQQFIETLKQEKAQGEAQLVQMREELGRREAVEDVVARLSKPNEPTEPKVDQPVVSGLDEAKVQDIIQNTLRQQTQESAAQTNLNMVLSSLTEAYGDKAKQVVADKAKELNTTPSSLEALAKENPTMALSLLGGVVPVSKAPTTTSTITALNPKPADGELTFPTNLARGGYSNRELGDAWAETKRHVHNKLGVTE